jgi:hypothetical protein
MASDFIASIGPSQEPLKRIDEVGRERMIGRNPELLVVNNPGGRSKKMRKRRKSSSSKLSVRLGGKRYGWRALVKKYKSIRKAAAVWRRKPKYAGRKALGRCRKAKTCYKRRATRKRTRCKKWGPWRPQKGGGKARKCRGQRIKQFYRRRKTSYKRRKARNGKLSIRFRGKKVSYKTLARRLGVRGAAKVWRSSPKLHAGKAIPGCGSRRRRRRSR